MKTEKLYAKSVEYASEVYLLMNKHSSIFVNDKYRGMLIKQIYRYAMPLVELEDNSIKAIDLYIQSLIISYTMYLDLFFDEFSSRRLYTITNLIYSEIVTLISKYYGDMQAKIFANYSYRYNIYLEVEKIWDNPMNYKNNYLNEGRTCKAEILLYVPTELEYSNVTEKAMRYYINYMLFVDDVIDYKSDIKNKTLTYVNTKYGVCNTINFRIFYDEYLHLSSQLENIPSCIVQDVKKEIEYGLKRKKIFE